MHKQPPIPSKHRNDDYYYMLESMHGKERTKARARRTVFCVRPHARRAQALARRVATLANQTHEPPHPHSKKAARLTPLELLHARRSNVHAVTRTRRALKTHETAQNQTHMSKVVAGAHVAAVDAVEAAVREEQIDCNFLRLDGYLFPHDDSHSASRVLDKELDAALRAGVLSDVMCACACIVLCVRACSDDAGTQRTPTRRPLAPFCRPD